VSNTTVIREFLVGLGFSLDEAGLKKFQGGIEKATKAVFTLAVTVEATAATVAVGISRFAANLEQLYFASQRTGVAVANLKAFDRAAQNLGASADEAQSAIEGLAHSYRVNPFGASSIIGLLGGNPNDDNIKQLLEIIPALQKLPTNVGLGYAQQLGISERMYLALRSGQFAQDYAHSQKLYGGADWQKTAADAHQFGIELRDLETVVQSFGAQVYEALQKRLGLSVENLTKWLQKNGPALAGRMVEILTKIWDIAERIVHVIGWVVNQLIAWDKETDGWSTRLIAFGAVLKLFGGMEIIGGIISLAAAFVKLGSGIAVAGASGSGLIGLLGRLGLIGAAGAVGYGIGTLMNMGISKLIQSATGDKDASLGTLLYDSMHRDDQALNYFQDHGWSHAQASGIVANLEAESGLYSGAVGDHGLAVGIAQWHPERQAMFKSLYGKSVQDSSFEEQLAFVQWELTHSMRNAGNLLRAAKNSAYLSGSVVSRYYEAPAATAAAAAARGQAAVNIDQKTTIHVVGSDPVATAKQVAREQASVNAEIVRTAATAAQ
jgi:hypothetical protein